MKNYIAKYKNDFNRVMSRFQMVVPQMDMTTIVPEKSENGELKILGEKIVMKKDSLQ